MFLLILITQPIQRQAARYCCDVDAHMEQYDLLGLTSLLTVVLFLSRKENNMVKMAELLKSLTAHSIFLIEIKQFFRRTLSSSNVGGFLCV